MYNKKLVDNICKRKLFKTNTFHHNNTEEEYYWDDYDTTYGYKMNTEACCLPEKPVNISTHLPKSKITNRPVNLHANEKIKTLLTWNTYINNKSTQTDPPTTTDENTQTFPQYYFSQTSRFPGPSSNFNFAPFNPNIFL